MTTDYETAVPIELMAIDPDQDELSFTHTDPEHGVLTGEGSELTYTPDPEFSGTDRFTFTVTDAGGLSDTAEVTITVLEAPVPPYESTVSGLTAVLDGSVPRLAWRAAEAGGAVLVVRRVGDVAPLHTADGVTVYRGTATSLIDLVEAGSTYSYSVWAVDPAGRVSTRRSSLTLTALRKPTASAPAHAILGSRGPALPVRWGSDADPAGTRYQVEYRVGQGAWQPWQAATSARAGSFGAQGAPAAVQQGSGYQFRVTALDAWGHRTGAATAGSRVGYDDRRATYSDGWATRRDRDGWLGTVSVTKVRHASLRFAGEGRTYRLYGDRLPTGARIGVFVDGRRVDVVGTRARQARSRVLLWERTYRAERQRTVQVVNLGRKGATTVRIDGFDYL